jgi:hypothetical protein
VGDRPAAGLIRNVVAAGLGLCIGLAALEAIVRPFASVQPPPLPDIAHDVPAGPLIESRQLDEGVATSHFTHGGSRWTGRTPAPDEPTIVIIGDSYVVAREVADDETMGAWIERFARADGRPLMVRQYGWRAARPAQYVHVASQVARRWSPSRVVVILADNDFDSRALVDTIEAAPRPGGVLALSSLAVLARHRTILLERRARYSLDRWRRRFGFQTTAQPTSSEDPLPPPSAVSAVSAEAPTGIEANVVAALSRAFGPTLAIVYVANTRVADDADPNERRLATACASRGVPYVSTRPSMRALEKRGIISRGFSTTTPGNGHLNVEGHEMIGRLIWSLIR